MFFWWRVAEKDFPKWFGCVQVTSNSSVIRQKGDLKTGVSRKQSTLNVRFSENLACLVFLKHPFWDSPFCLISDELCRFEHFQNFLKSSLSTLALKYARNRKLSYLVEYRILFIWGLFRKNWWSNWISHTCVIFVWIYIYLYSKYLQ